MPVVQITKQAKEITEDQFHELWKFVGEIEVFYEEVGSRSLHEVAIELQDYFIRADGPHYLWVDDPELLSSFQDEEKRGTIWAFQGYLEWNQEKHHFKLLKRKRRIGETE